MEVKTQIQGAWACIQCKGEHLAMATSSAKLWSAMKTVEDEIFGWVYQ